MKKLSGERERSDVGRLMAVGLCLVIGVELYALFLPDRRFVLWGSGVVVAVVLLAVRWLLVDPIAPAPAESNSDDPGESLRRWMSQTETLIRRSESTRADWDRHLRPRLAREFQMATGERQAKDSAALQATGLMLFGAELWQWVDPENIVRTGGREPGPGRAVLDEILQRLERV
jgi:hypothetical protein